MSDLFTEYDERPARCAAVLVGYDSIEEIARYFGEYGYQSVLTRSHENGFRVTKLTISHEGTTKMPQGFELTMEVPNIDKETGCEASRQVLIYDRPPRLADADEFDRQWAEVKR
jgi:hypothetical protein